MDFVSLCRAVDCIVFEHIIYNDEVRAVLPESCTTHGSTASFALDAGSVRKFQAVVSPAVALKLTIVFEDSFVLLDFCLYVPQILTGCVSACADKKHIAGAFGDCAPKNISKRPADRLTVFAGFYEHCPGKFLCRFEQFLIFLADKRLECARQIV